MSMAVHMANPGLGALGLEPVKLLYVGQLFGDQAAASCKRFCGVEQRALLRRGNRYFALAPTLGPAVHEKQAINFIGPLRPDLDRLFAAQPERGLQLER